jgi:tetratricopeptide (TPR) repeat protein
MRLFSLIIILSLILGVITACGNGDNEKTASVAQQTRSSELIKQGDELFDNKQQSEALEIYKSAADTALTENDNAGLTEAYSQMARCYLSMDNKEEGRPWLAKAEAIAKDTEPLGWTRYLGVKGRYLWKDAVEKQGKAAPVADEAAKIFTELYDYSVKHKLHSRAVDAANMMSIVGDMESRIEWGLKGIEAAEIGNLESWMAPLWNNLGWNYSDLGRYDKSLEALKKARRYHYKKGLEKPMLISDWSVAYAFRMAGQPDSSMAWCMRIVPWAKDIYDEDRSPENAEWLGMCYRELAEASLAKEEEKRALAGFRSAKMYFDKANMKEWDPDGYKELNEKIDELAGSVGRYR